MGKQLKRSYVGLVLSGLVGAKQSECVRNKTEDPKFPHYLNARFMTQEMVQTKDNNSTKMKKDTSEPKEGSTSLKEEVTKKNKDSKVDKEDLDKNKDVELGDFSKYDIS